MLRLLPLFLLTLASAAALATEAPDALVRRTTDDVLSALRAEKDIQSGSLTKVIQIAEAKILPHFDFAHMTRLAVGRNWRAASEAQKEALMKEFRTLLVRTYAASLAQYRNQTIEVKPAKLAAGDADTIVRTQVIQQGGPPIPLDYGMAKGDKAWRVYDVVIDGVSLVTTYRGSFNDQIQKAGIDGLVKTLADRNRASEAKSAPKAEPKK